MEQPKITAADIRKLLHERFSDTRQYAYAEEVGNSTGANQTRRLDMVVIDCFRSHGFAIEGFEIKISKSDLRRELQDSTKHNIFYKNLDYYSLAAPADVVDLDIIPKQWGIYLAAVAQDGSLSLRRKRKPLSLHDDFIGIIDKEFVAALLRAMWGSRPTDSMIEAVKQEAQEQALREAGYIDYERQIQSLQEDLSAYKELKERLNLWGAGSVERAVQDYESFLKLNIPNLVWNLKRLTDVEKELKCAIKALEGRVESEENE